MYELNNTIILVTTASAIPNNLALQSVTRNGRAFAVGVVHGGYMNVIPVREGDMRSKYIPCVEPGTKPRHVTTTVTQMKWFCLHNEQLLVVLSSLGLHVYDDEGRNCCYSHPCVDSSDSGGTYARGLAIVGENLLCVGNNTGSIRLFMIPQDHTDIKLLEKLSMHQKSITDLVSNQLSNLLASADESGSIMFWCIAQDVRCVATIQSFGFPCTSLQMWREFVLAGYGSGHIRMFDTKTASLLTEVAAHAQWITGIDLAPSKGLLLSVSEDSFAKVWQVDRDARTICHMFTIPVENRMLVGGRFMNPFGTEFCVSAFDSNEVLCYAS